jgi:hypothetical protein
MSPSLLDFLNLANADDIWLDIAKSAIKNYISSALAKFLSNMATVYLSMRIGSKGDNTIHLYRQKATKSL